MGTVVADGRLSAARCDAWTTALEWSAVRSTGTLGKLDGFRFLQIGNLMPRFDEAGMDQRDLVGAITHLAMAGWGILATLFLLWRTRNHGRIRWIVAGYGVSIISLYAASGLFHLLIYLATGPVNGYREQAVAYYWVFQTLDKSAIFLLIAMSNVVVMAYLLPPVWRRWCMTFMLSAAILGIGSLWLLPKLPHAVMVGIYAGMGTAGLLPFRQYVRVLCWRGIAWVLLFAGCFLGGAAIEVTRWPVLLPGWIGSHELFHVAIMAGTYTHFVFVVRFVITQPSGQENRHGTTPRWPAQPLDPQRATHCQPQAIA